MCQSLPAEIYHRYWGKSGDEGYHLLVYHGMDTCSVAKSWIEHNVAFVCELSERSAMSVDTLSGLLLLFVALHDVGKFSVTFQNLNPDLLKKLQHRESKKEYQIRHDNLGWMLWECSLKAHVIEHLKRYGSMSERGEIHATVLLDVFARIAVGHHGEPPNERINDFGAVFSRPDIEAALRYIDDLLETFLPSKSKVEIARWADKAKTERKSALSHLKRSSWRLAGMMVLSDWISEQAGAYHAS